MGEVKYFGLERLARFLLKQVEPVKDPVEVGITFGQKLKEYNDTTENTSTGPRDCA